MAEVVQGHYGTGFARLGIGSKINCPNAFEPFLTETDAVFLLTFAKKNNHGIPKSKAGLPNQAGTHAPT